MTDAARVVDIRMTDEQPTEEPSTGRAKRTSRLRAWSAVLMSLAALATSWASYQASLWSGEQMQRGAASAAYRAKSTRASTRAGQLRMIDIGVFGHWMNATVRRDTALAAFVRTRFRREFAPAFESWMASKPLVSHDAAATPFAHPQYRLADDIVADSLDHMADRESAASQRANRISDSYVLDAVIMATVLFFAGTEQASVTRLRILMLVIATSMCVTGIVRLIVAPRV